MTKQVLLVWNEPPENLKLYLFEVNSQGHALAKAAHGLMGNTVMTEEKETAWNLLNDYLEGSIPDHDDSEGTEAMQLEPGSEIVAVYVSGFMM